METLEGNLFDSLLGDSLDGVKGIHVDQDQKSHSVNVRVEIKIAYGIRIPEKAEEIQTRIVEDMSNLTGLHVATVHVIFKNLTSKKAKPNLKEVLEKRVTEDSVLEEYEESF